MSHSTPHSWQAGGSPFSGGSFQNSQETRTFLRSGLLCRERCVDIRIFLRGGRRMGRPKKRPEVPGYGGSRFAQSSPPRGRGWPGMQKPAARPHMRDGNRRPRLKEQESPVPGAMRG